MWNKSVSSFSRKYSYFQVSIFSMIACFNNVLAILGKLVFIVQLSREEGVNIIMFLFLNQSSDDIVVSKACFTRGEHSASVVECLT